MKKFKIDNLNSISKVVFKHHMVRKNTKQKMEFAKYLEENLPDLENFKVEEIKGNKNIVIGDINNCKYVFTAHYDTPPTMLILPNFLTPKNIFMFIVYQLFMTVIMIGFAFLLAFLGTLIGLDPLVGYFIGLFLCIFQMMYGYPNKNNYNDNTSGVVTLIELYLSMTKEERSKCVFIFFDNEEKGLQGSGAYNKKYKELMEEREVINFDCVADGDYLMLIHNKVSEETLNIISTDIDNNEKHIVISESKKAIYPSDQKKFKHNVGVAAFHKKKFIGYYVDRIHTIFDTNFDEDNIFVLVNHFKKLITKE